MLFSTYAEQGVGLQPLASGAFWKSDAGMRGPRKVDGIVDFSGDSEPRIAVSSVKEVKIFRDDSAIAVGRAAYARNSAADALS
jgi:hypothetical protein